MRSMWRDVQKQYFYDNSLLALAYVWAGSFFIGDLIAGNFDMDTGMIWFAQNLAASSCHFQQKLLRKRKS